MDTIRIGNDINILWKVFSRNGYQYALDDKDIELWLVSGPYKSQISTFQVDRINEISFSIDAASLSRYGIYKIVMRITDKEAIADDATMDLVQVFQIVSKSYPNPTAGAIDGAVDLEFQSILNNVFVSTLRGKSAYEIAQDHGYKKSEEEWLKDPIDGIMGTGIAETEIDESTEQSGTSTVKFIYNNGEEYELNIKNGTGIVSISENQSTADSGISVLTITLSDGTTKTLNVRNGKGIASVVQETTGVGSDALNVIRVTYSDGNSMTFTVKNGSQGNSGYTGAAGELEVVNNLSDGGAAKALSAEQGKLLNEKLETITTMVPVDISSFNKYSLIIGSQGTLVSSSGTSTLMPVSPGQIYRFVNNSTSTANIAVLATSTLGSAGSTPTYATGYSGRITISVGNEYVVNVPQDAQTIYIRLTDSSDVDVAPNVYSNNISKYFEETDEKLVDVEEQFYSPVDLSALEMTSKCIASNNTWTTSIGKSVLVPVNAGDKVKIYAAGSSSANIAFFTVASYDTLTPPFSSEYPNRIVLSLSSDPLYVTVPNDTVCIYVRMTDSSDNDVHAEVNILYANNFSNDIASLKRFDKNLKLNYMPGYWLPPSSVDGSPVQRDGWFVTDYIWVRKGCTLDWIYNTLPESTVLYIYDESKLLVSYYNSQAGEKRTITNFAGSRENDAFYVRTSFPFENIDKSFILVDGTMAWSRKEVDIFDLVEALPDFPASNFKTPGCHTGGIWQDYGESYLIPVEAGDVFYMKRKNYDNYLAFYSEAPVTGSEPPMVPGTTTTVQKTSEWGRFVAPYGAQYLMVVRFFNSTSDHTPYIKKASYSDNNLDADGLVVGTFNSSYNTTDVSAIREKFCAKMYGKDNVETFLFFTDPHLTPQSRYETMTELVRDRYISTMQKYYNSLPLDMCICGGDWLNFYHTPAEACSFLGYCDAYMRKLFKNYYPLFGNHDNNPYYPDSSSASWNNALDYTTIRNLMFRENRNPYYSFDGLNTKFYVLNSGVSFVKTMTDSNYSRLLGDRWAQIDWLANKLLQDDADNSIIAMHIYANGSNEEDWFSEETGYRANGIHALGANTKLLAMAYNDRQSISLNGHTYNFSGCSGRVMFILCGHTHWDYVDTSGELPIVCTTNLEGGHYSGGSYSRSLTATFDCCLADLDNGAFYMDRVGAGISRVVNYKPIDLAVGSSIELTSNLSGVLTWSTRDGSIASVTDGIVAGVAPGTVGILATVSEEAEEYWIIRVH